MSKRNLILLIIILGIALVVFFGFLYFKQNVTIPGANTGPGTNFISTFNPFGNGKPTKPITPVTTIEPGYQPNYSSETGLTLKKVSSMPVAGFISYAKERFKDIPIEQPAITTPTPKTTKTTKPTPPLTEFSTTLRYVEKSTGNIYETFADKIEERKFSTTVVPKIYEAFLGDKGEFVIMRYLKGDNKTIETFTSTLPREYLGADATPNEIKGAFLPEDIKDVSLSPDAENMFYLLNIKDNAIGTTFNLLGNKKTQVFVSPFTEWLSSWPNNKIITLTTKPASGIPGYMYSIDLGTKNFNRIFGGINGLTTLTAQNGQLVLYGNDNLSLGVYHIDTKVSDKLAVKTLPEKCVWGKTNDKVYCAVPRFITPDQYPDAWYQGEVSFSDQLWEIDIKTGNATMLLDPITLNNGEGIDGIKLALEESGKYLFFVNKKDSFLWEMGLKQ